MKSVRIGIIGGTGGMGRWFERYFTGAGHRVLISGRKTELTSVDLAKTCNVVILSTPLEAAIKIAETIGPILKEDQLLMDFCSLKESILKSMLMFTAAQVVGTHPMFGPFTESIKGQNIIICPGRGGGWLNWLEGELQSRGAVLTRMDAATHDKNMAVVQGLTHLLTICLGRTLQKMGMAPDKAMVYSTPIFRLNIDFIGRLFAQDPELYASLISENRYVTEAFETFLTTMDEGKSHLLSGRKEDGLLFLEEIRNFMGNFCQAGLEESNEILNTLFSLDSSQPSRD